MSRTCASSFCRRAMGDVVSCLVRYSLNVIGKLCYSGTCTGLRQCPALSSYQYQAQWISAHSISVCVLISLISLAALVGRPGRCCLTSNVLSVLSKCDFDNRVTDSILLGRQAQKSCRTFLLIAGFRA